ncbi:unnamed protein product [Peronospora belbahrii]|uniref:Uncharacterized protein n=1 Tax=Peronospora belbahrii TaxID=622444 RepID=A0ABN8CSK4_9STRA|nr:unnamed protein product [Peronospora belbahrii]
MMRFPAFLSSLRLNSERKAVKNPVASLNITAIATALTTRSRMFVTPSFYELFAVFGAASLRCCNVREVPNKKTSTSEALSSQKAIYCQMFMANSKKLMD